VLEDGFQIEVLLIESVIRCSHRLTGLFLQRLLSCATTTFDAIVLGLSHGRLAPL
jgi:hypothetical protein